MNQHESIHEFSSDMSGILKNLAEVARIAVESLDDGETFFSKECKKCSVMIAEKSARIADLTQALSTEHDNTLTNLVERKKVLLSEINECQDQVQKERLQADLMEIETMITQLECGDIICTDQEVEITSELCHLKNELYLEKQNLVAYEKANQKAAFHYRISQKIEDLKGDLDLLSNHIAKGVEDGMPESLQHMLNSLLDMAKRKLDSLITGDFGETSEQENLFGLPFELTNMMRAPIGMVIEIGPHGVSSRPIHSLGEIPEGRTHRQSSEMLDECKRCIGLKMGICPGKPSSNESSTSSIGDVLNQIMGQTLHAGGRNLRGFNSVDLYRYLFSENNVSPVQDVSERSMKVAGMPLPALLFEPLNDLLKEMAVTDAEAEKDEDPED